MKKHPTANPALFGEASEEEGTDTNDSSGHTANRTDMLPWESCGPDCPVCSEFER
jgi:hypothetical protein